MAYKQAMREFQDDYWTAVGEPAGLTRIGPRLRRLSKPAHNAEKAQAKLSRAISLKQQEAQDKLDETYATIEAAGKLLDAKQDQIALANEELLHITTKKVEEEQHAKAAVYQTECAKAETQKYGLLKSDLINEVTDLVHQEGRHLALCDQKTRQVRELSQQITQLDQDIVQKSDEKEMLETDINTLKIEKKRLQTFVNSLRRKAAKASTWLKYFGLGWLMMARDDDRTAAINTTRRRVEKIANEEKTALETTITQKDRVIENLQRDLQDSQATTTELYISQRGQKDATDVHAATLVQVMEHLPPTYQKSSAVIVRDLLEGQEQVSAALDYAHTLAPVMPAQKLESIKEATPLGTTGDEPTP